MVKNIVKPRGRPRNFDEAEALEQATQLFWSKGYDAVTIDDLVAGMGVARPSLYSIFGDKRTLFLRALHAYAEAKGALATKALLSPSSVRDSIKGFMRFAVTSATEENSAWGCLLVCVAPLVDDPEVRKYLQEGAAAVTALLESRFQAGMASGELPSDFPATTRANQAIDLSRGLTLKAQMGTPRKILLAQADEAAGLVLLPRGTSPTTEAAPKAPRRKTRPAPGPG